MGDKQLGSKLELVVPSNEDFFLTGNPEITFFKCAYRRHTHFSQQLFNINFDTPVDFDSITEVKIPILGDLLHRMYLKCTLPSVHIKKDIDNEKLNEYKYQLDKMKQLYQVFKTLANTNMNSYVEIARLEKLQTLTVDNLYQIINNNSAVFESKVINIDGVNYSYNIYLSKELRSDDFKSIVDKKNPTQTRYTYGNYLATLTMTKENIKSILINSGKKEEKENIINILTTIKQNIEELDKRFIYNIETLQEQYNNYNNSYYNFAWVKHLGHNLIDYIEIRIGNDTIDRQYGQWIDMWWEMSGNKYKEDMYLDLIGEELSVYDTEEKPETTIYVPIPFWFCRHIGLSLPLICLQYSDVMIRMKLKSFKDCCYSDYDKANLNDIDKHIINASLLCETYYLDKMERMKFARATHEYLIEQTQFNTETFTLNEKNTHQFNFAHPVKGVVWTLQKSKNLLINENKKNNDQFNNLIIPNATIYEDNIIRNELSLENETLENEEHIYFENVIPYHRFENSGISGVYSYWYSMYPFEQQPSGSCNMSFIKNNKLHFTVKPELIVNNDNDNRIIDIGYEEEYKAEHVLNCYALNYNILRITNGSGKLAFK